MSKNQDLGELINGIKSLSTNQLNAPAYTSATSFTGTIAGFLGFDSSGNILTASGSSQWITSGANIYYSSGAVGIGISSPLNALHISGTTYGSSRLYIQRTSGALGTYSLGIQNADNCFGIVDEAQGNLTRLYINNSGKIGIGITNPSITLDLFAPSDQGIQFRYSATDTNERMQITGRYSTTQYTGFNFKVQRDPAVGLETIMSVGFGGNVQIGTQTDSGYKLQVNGDVNITGTYRVNGTPIGTGGGGVSGSGTTNYLAKWSGSTALTNSQIFDNGSSIGLRTASPFYVIDYQLTGSLRLGYFIGSIDGTDNASGIVAHNGNGITQTVPFGFSGSKFAWYIGTNEAMRIDTNRNLLINTTGGVTGGGALQVNGDVNVTGTFRVNGVQYSTGGGGGGITGGGTASYVPKFTGSTSIGDSALFDDGNFSMIIGATAFSNAIPLRAQKYLGVYGPASSGIILRTADGDPNIASCITREFGAGNGLYIYDDRQIWLGQSGLLQVINISNNAVGIKTSAVGTPYALNLPNDALNAARAFSWYTYSDERVKRDIEEINYGINEVMKMKPVRYKHYSSVFENNTWKLENQYSTEIGFVAQEMDKIIKEVVIRGSETELWSLDKSKLIPVLVKAVQELKAELDELKQNNA